MFKLRMTFFLTLMLLTFDMVAQDFYISGGDNDALQAAILAANQPGSQVTIHLEAGQIFEVAPWLGEVKGNLKIEGNGAIFGDVSHQTARYLGSVAADGVVTITGVTFVNVASGSLSCTLLYNHGSLTLDRVTFSQAYIGTSGHFIQCTEDELLWNNGSAELVNVTIVGTLIAASQGTIIRTVENGSTNIRHLTVIDTIGGTVLSTASGGSISVNNSIIFAGQAGYTEETLSICDGPIIDKGGNISSTVDCGFSGGLIDRTSLSQTVEKGHDAWVVPLNANSMAVDAGNPDYCQKLDGRGFERDVLCDSGAYEVMASNHGGELGRGGISGFYYTPESDGNYIQVQRAYDGNVVVIWNTFDTSGAQAWINAVGSYQDGVITAAAYRNLGGVLQPGAGASGGTETEWGTLKVTAHNCWNITVEYESTDPEFASGTFEAQRIAYVHDLGCSER